MIRRHVASAAVLLSALAVMTTLRRRTLRWRHATETRLHAGSHVIDTRHGPIEFGDDAGPGAADPAKPPLLVLHGTGGGYAVGLVLGRAVAASSADGSPGPRVIAPSRPGYLRTPLSTGRTFTEQAAALTELLDALGIERAAIAGVSSGAPVAIQLALRDPARVERLVLWAAVTSRAHPRVARITRGPLATNIGAWLTVRVIPATARMRLRRGRIRDPRALATLSELGAAFFPLDLSAAGMRNDDTQVAALPDLALETLGMPTLIVHGTADRAVPFADATHAAQRIPAARLVPVRGGDHALSLVSPEALHAIARFLVGRS